jgi:hypothetical protein
VQHYGKRVLPSSYFRVIHRRRPCGLPYKLGLENVLGPDDVVHTYCLVRRAGRQSSAVVIELCIMLRWPIHNSKGMVRVKTKHQRHVQTHSPNVSPSMP